MKWRFLKILWPSGNLIYIMKKAFSFCIFQLDYYSLDAPSHWSTVSNVNEEIYTVDNLASSSTIVFVVRAQNHHGLSPPSPMSKVSETNELQKIGYFIQILQIYPTELHY